MVALFKNNFVQIGIISIFLVSLVVGITAPSVALGGAAAIEAAAAGGKTNTNPGFIGTQIGQFIGNFILSIASMVTWAGGKLLEVSIDKFILQLGTIINGSIGVAIDSIWRVIRDMANLAFIFGFIYIGIMTIIDSSSANTKRMLAAIIIGALLINFSLFFTKIIIDVSNYIAVEIYNTLITTPAGTTGSISAKFADILGITSFYKFPEADQYAGTTAMGNVAFYFMAAIMLIVAGFVFAAGAILLLTRFVALVFIMIFSPILFAATVFPQTKSAADDLWKKLINYSFFAPAYLILLVVSIKILEAIVGVFKKGSLANAFTGGGTTSTAQADTFDVVISFVVAILFLIMSLQIAKKFGVAGAEKVMSVGNSLRGKGQKMLANGALWAPRVATRAAVGGVSRAALTKFDKWQAKDPSSTVGKAVRGAMKFTNADRNVRNTLESGTKVKAGLKYSYEDNEKYTDERNKRLTTNRAVAKRNDDIDAVTKTGATPTPVQMDDMVKAIKALTTDQMKDDMDINVLSREEVAVHLSIKQIDELAKTGKYSDAQIDAIKTAKKNAVKNIASVGTAMKDPHTGAPIGSTMVGGQTQQQILAQRGSEELAKMPIEVFTSSNMAEYITPDAVEAKMKAGISTKEMDDIRTNIDTQIVSANMAWGLAGKSGIPPYSKQWENWTNRSTFGARLGLTI